MLSASSVYIICAMCTTVLLYREALLIGTPVRPIRSYPTSEVFLLPFNVIIPGGPSTSAGCFTIGIPIIIVQFSIYSEG